MILDRYIYMYILACIRILFDTASIPLAAMSLLKQRTRPDSRTRSPRRRFNLFPCPVFDYPVSSCFRLLFRPVSTPRARAARRLSILAVNVDVYIHRCVRNGPTRKAGMTKLSEAEVIQVPAGSGLLDHLVGWGWGFGRAGGFGMGKGGRREREREGDEKGKEEEKQRRG
ncbi:hypothetical protein B0H34DRAFT_712619 [Crassisporium funariophilum]|nr:hypothetical protein B0H34DRAFT_712619 [Crassisporium funariophilum]